MTDDSGTTRQVNTDSNGRYAIGNLAPGSLTVAAGAYGFVSQQVSVRAVDNTALDFTLTPTAACAVIYKAPDIGESTIGQMAWNVSAAATSREIDVFTNHPGCTWSLTTVASSNGWLTFAPASGAGNGSVRLDIQQNQTGANRSSSVSLSPCPSDSGPGFCQADSQFSVFQSK